MQPPSLKVLIVAASASSSACYATLPPHLGEGTTVLAPAGVNLNVAAGGASFEGKDQTNA